MNADVELLTAALLATGACGLFVGMGGSGWARHHAAGLHQPSTKTVVWDEELTEKEVAWARPVVLCQRHFYGFNVFVVRSDGRTSDLVMRPGDGAFGECPESLSLFMSAPERACIVFYTADGVARSRFRDAAYVEALMEAQPELRDAGLLATVNMRTLVTRVLRVRPCTVE